MLGLTPFERKGYDLFNAFDNFDRDFFGSRMTPSARTTGFSTDIKETENGYELTSELPGFKKEDIKAELKDGYLTVTAETSKDDKTSKDDTSRYICRERFYSTCSRNFYVGKELTQEDIKAKFENGVLTLNVPKKEALPQREEERYISIL